MDAGLGRKLVSGRGCESCDACCVALTLEDPELRKLQEHRFPNWRSRRPQPTAAGLPPLPDEPPPSPPTPQAERGWRRPHGPLPTPTSTGPSVCWRCYEHDDEDDPGRRAGTLPDQHQGRHGAPLAVSARQQIYTRRDAALLQLPTQECHVVLAQRQTDMRIVLHHVSAGGHRHNRNWRFDEFGPRRAPRRRPRRTAAAPHHAALRSPTRPRAAPAPNPGTRPPPPGVPQPPTARARAATAHRPSQRRGRHALSR